MTIKSPDDLISALHALAGDPYAVPCELLFTSRSSGDISLCRAHALKMSPSDITDLWRGWDVEYAEIIHDMPEDCDACWRERVVKVENPRTLYLQALDNYQMHALNRRN